VNSSAAAIADATRDSKLPGRWSSGAGRWPTDKGFGEWYGPPRKYDEALWPTDPFYDPTRDPVTRMLEIRHGDADVTGGEQLTLDVGATATPST
jgi:arylsulfatase